MNKLWEPKYVLVLVAILAATGVVTISILRDRLVNQQYRNITAMGQGRVSYQPDTATVNLGVQIDKSAKPEEALNNLNQKIAAVKKEILALGVKEEEVETKNYFLSPQYDYKDGVQTVAGYSANQQLAVKVKNLANNRDLINKVVAAASKAGANQVNGVSFSSSQIEEYKQQARVKAIEDAKAKAVKLAEAADVKLIGIINWYENYVQSEALSAYADGKGGMGGAAVSGPQINPATNEVVMEIGLTYNIKD